MTFFTGKHNSLYLFLSSTYFKDTYFSMAGSGKYVSSLPTLFRTIENICINNIYIAM